jgi:hypothetical protein
MVAEARKEAVDALEVAYGKAVILAELARRYRAMGPTTHEAAKELVVRLNEARNGV